MLICNFIFLLFHFIELRLCVRDLSFGIVTEAFSCLLNIMFHDNQFGDILWRDVWTSYSSSNIRSLKGLFTVVERGASLSQIYVVLHVLLQHKFLIENWKRISDNVEKKLLIRSNRVAPPHPVAVLVNLNDARLEELLDFVRNFRISQMSKKRRKIFGQRLFA